MATDRDFIAYVHEQAALGVRLTDKRMFGEYAVYLDGKVVAFACDNSLLLKPTDAGLTLIPRLVEGRPYPEAKVHYVIDEYLDDTGLLQGLLQATADALPEPGRRRKTGRPNARPGAEPTRRSRTSRE